MHCNNEHYFAIAVVDGAVKADNMAGACQHAVVPKLYIREMLVHTCQKRHTSDSKAVIYYNVLRASFRV